MKREGEGLRRRGKFGPETVGLELREIGQIAAADSGGKAEEIFDQRRRAGLPAGRIALQHDGVESFRGRVDRSGQAGGTGAHDGEVATNFILRRRRRAGEAGRRSARPRAATAGASGAPVAVMSAGRSRLVRLKTAGQRLRPASLFKFDQAMRDVVLGQEIVQLMAVARVAQRDDAKAAQTRGPA